MFFENTKCENCGAVLGYVPSRETMLAFDATGGESWTALGGADLRFRPCRNYQAENVCNWMIQEEDHADYCLSCRLTQTIPALNKTENKALWFRLEQAKRRLVYSLHRLKLPLPTRVEDPKKGVAFHFLEDAPNGTRVLTGHNKGIITFNISEADDGHRETTRKAMHEPYRTLLGHFRHEIGHYYWDMLIEGTSFIDGFRLLFGDERLPYDISLQTHYEKGAPSDWSEKFISAYASAHPWEDWAETWAHYLHIVDGLHTAAQWGVKLHPLKAIAASVDESTLKRASFQKALIEQWLPLTCFLNCLNRSLGHGDAYPFTIATPVIEKLSFVHQVIEKSGPKKTRKQAP